MTVFVYDTTHEITPHLHSSQWTPVATIPLSCRQSQHQQHRTIDTVCIVNRFVRLVYGNNSTSVKSHRTVSCQPTCPLIS